MKEKKVKEAGFTPGEAVVEDGEEDEYGVEAGEDDQQVVEGVPHGVARQHVHRQQVAQQAHQAQAGLWDRAPGHWVSQQVIGLVSRLPSRPTRHRQVWDRAAGHWVIQQVIGLVSMLLSRPTRPRQVWDRAAGHWVSQQVAQQANQAQAGLA
jgi:hypothetical protein